MFIQSKKYKLLLPLIAYIFFAVLWIFNYMSIWHSNIPEETEFIKGKNFSFYIIYGVLFIISFMIFLLFGIIYFVKNSVPKFVTYVLIGNLVFSAYYVWHYSIMFKRLPSNVNFLFLNLVLFAISIFKLANQKQSTLRS